YYKVLDDLIPFTKYRFSIRCRISTANLIGTASKPTILWSNYVHLTLNTPTDKPYRCPQFLNSSFESSLTVGGDRSITVYWRPVPAEYSNAPKLRYRIEYSTLKESPSWKSEQRMASAFVNTEPSSVLLNDHNTSVEISNSSITY